MSRCPKCSSDMVADPFSSDMICPHCDDGGPVTFRCDNCDRVSEKSVLHPLYPGEVFCSETCCSDFDAWLHTRTEMRNEDHAIELARKENRI